MDSRSRIPNVKLAAFIVLVAAIQPLAGCQSEPFRSIDMEIRGIFGTTRGEPALATGIGEYEAGNYPAAAESLHSALFEGLASDDRVKAHKYLAFINCVSNRPSACLVEFRRALAINPNLELSAAEAGHPIWGPVFRAIKSAR
ncbi:MAG: TssQ family T6SS-associated lipoprotein [Betaproteobacteria bacterium]|nr:TssQ family T6SS-associated lipoprotein [Betaproteobacteria bacterium]